MGKRLLSVGLDVGTTSTQMILSELTVENGAGSFSVPEMRIGSRKILYKSPIHFTPLLSESRVDGKALRSLVEQEYARAGIRRGDVDTGAVIVTGETSRKENADAVLSSLADFAGDFVVATAGPDLESVLAAKGAGADEYSGETGKPVLHMDIGGGTANLAWIEDGRIVATGCLNVGGRLVKLDNRGQIVYVSPVLNGIFPLIVGEVASREQIASLAETLVQALEMAAGLREATPLLEKLWTKESRFPAVVRSKEWVISFSGGVADCIHTERDWLAFGDIGPILGQRIRKSRLCQGPYRLGSETIRATVIGAGCHSTQLSGSTVFYQNVAFPLKNLPVIHLSRQEQETPEAAQIIRRRLARQDGSCVLSLPGKTAPSYTWVQALAQRIAEGMQGQPCLVAVEADMAKALGQAMSGRLPPGSSCLCIDSVKLTEGSFLDVGAPVGPALPVVVKTLVLGR